MFVKPGPRPDDPDRQFIVRAPNGRVLPPIGEDVPETQFWNRRLRDGDVVLVKPILTEDPAFNPAAPATPRETAP